MKPEAKLLMPRGSIKTTIGEPFVRFLEPIEFNREYVDYLSARSQYEQKNRTNETQLENRETE